MRQRRACALHPVDSRLFTQQDRIRSVEDFELPGFVVPDLTADRFSPFDADRPFSIGPGDRDGEVDFSLFIVVIEVAAWEEARRDRFTESSDGLLVGLHGGNRLAVRILALEGLADEEKDSSENQRSRKNESETATPDDVDNFTY